MIFNESHPLYDVLKPCSPWLLYGEVHALNSGRYAEVAERLQAAAQRQRYYDGLLHGSLLVMCANYVATAFSSQHGGDSVLACLLGVLLAVNIHATRRQRRALAKAVTHLQQLANSQGPGSESPCSPRPA